MKSIKNKYKGQIVSVLHHINMMVQCDWTGSDVNAFENETSIEYLSKISGICKRNLHIYMKLSLNIKVG